MADRKNIEFGRALKNCQKNRVSSKSKNFCAERLREQVHSVQALAKTDNTSAVADHVKTTGHNIKWDHFEILASGKTDYHCKIKETLFIQELKPAFNVNVSNEKLMLYWLVVAFYRFTVKIVFS